LDCGGLARFGWLNLTTPPANKAAIGLGFQGLKKEFAGWHVFCCNERVPTAAHKRRWLKTPKQTKKTS
jgi:hypothetical protein